MNVRAGFAGLVTATAEVGGAPTGLRIADNVVLRKEGALMPRPASTSTALSRAYRAAFPYKGLMYQVDASGNYWRDNTLQLSASPAQTQLRADVQNVKEARGNLYFPTTQGVWKVTSTSDASLTRAGVLPTQAFAFASGLSTGSVSPELLTTNTQVGYRTVTVVTDPNGLIVRGRPSGALLVASTAGGQSPLVYMSAAITAPPPYKTQLELYRTRVFPTTAQIDDEYQLVKVFDLPAGSSWSASHVDGLPDIRRGTTLYTSPSRGGIEAANDLPPGCACVERYRTSLFFGNTTGPHRITVSYNPTPTNLVGVATGVGVRMTTGTTVAGSAAITSVANTVGLQVGMAIKTLTSDLMGQIVSIVGSTVTASVVAGAPQTAQTVWFTDAIVVDGVAIPVGIGANAGIGVVTPSSLSPRIWDTSLFSTFTAYELSPPVAGYTQTVVIERIARGGAPFTVKATHGGEMSPALPLASSGGAGTSSTSDVLPHGLSWSEPDEPEHTPQKNTARVGDAGRAILALVATKDRLLIFKEDGLFMMTGDTVRNFGIYPLDTTCLCILPGSVRRLKNTVYLLTNLGLAAVDDGGGVTVVSRPIQLEIAVIVNAIRAAQKVSGLYNMPGLSGITGAGDDAQGEYHLALGSSTPSFGGQVLVYSIPREGFTTFSYGTPAPVALSTDGEGNPLVLTASSLLTPTTTLGAIVSRVSPRAFSDPALVGKFWSHIVAGFSQLTGATSVQAVFTSSEPQIAASITETLESGPGTTTFNLPLGSLLRHPVPSLVRRAYLLCVELVVTIATGTFTLETLSAEARENIANKRPSHGTGAT
jgi:hypothetical protein